MHYVSVEGLTKSYGITPLFKDLSFHIEEGDKIALIARNGSGKSTLLRILAGKETPDQGKAWIHKAATVILLEQQPGLEGDKSVIENIFDHAHPVMDAIREYESLTSSDVPPEETLLNAAIAKMDELGAWDAEARVKQILYKLSIRQLQQPAKTLSGGQQKRLALAKVLIDISFSGKHPLLLLDEPTNHLDVSMIEWLEKFLSREKITLLLVTHDRYFLDNVCNEVMEIDDEQLFVYKGDYENYLEKKAAREEAAGASVEKARNLLRKELDWMRRQPKARSTKAKSRIDAFYDLQQKASTRSAEQQLELQVKMNRIGGKIIELKKVYKSFTDQPILKGFDYTFKKGERIGIIGRNGAGKSTFLNIIQGIEPPDSGKINIGDTVVFGYYSQQGLFYKEDKRVIDFVKDIAENFPLTNGAKISAAQFLNRFLFPPEKQYTFLSKLSGGEKRRLYLLAVLFRNPNFLILDEPTNDLDLPTLGILEEFLQDYPGCLLIVSHDRYFMDKLVHHLFVFEGDGIVKDFPGNYSQYREAENEKQKSSEKPGTVKTEAPPGNQPPSREHRKKKLSFNEKRELEMLDLELPRLEKEKQWLTTQLSDENLPYDKLQEYAQRIGDITCQVEKMETRWLELSEAADN